MKLPTIIALDIETTGLDQQKDKIIEVGAVKFCGNKIESEYQSLINPGVPIPKNISRLTGITDHMVRNAPPINEIIHELSNFIGDYPILGHNIRFDINFLKRYIDFPYNEIIDTYEIASVLLPTANRYNLKSLALELGVPVSTSHRAFDDAKATMSIYNILFDEAIHLPIALIAEITRLADNVSEWDGYPFFYYVMNIRSKEVVENRKIHHRDQEVVFPASHHKINGCPEKVHPLDPDSIASVFQPGGNLSDYFEDYEFRSEQTEMAISIADALSKGHHLMVEAGTGVGKSLAYLVPASLWATQNNTRVIVSTHTKNLQDQLINKDIPAVKQALNIPLQASILKGKNNYLCPRRLQAFIRRGVETPVEMRVIGKILVWRELSNTGDRNEINLNGVEEREIWSQLSAADDRCTLETCQRQMGGICPFYQAKVSAQSSHIIVVNHALLLSDIATGNRILPEFNYLVIDEAHQLESASTNTLSRHLTEFEYRRVIRDLGSSRSGVIGRLYKTIKGILPLELQDDILNLGQSSIDIAFQLESLLRALFTKIEAFIYEQRDGAALGKYSYQLRITPAIRTAPGWLDIEIAWENMLELTKALLTTIEQIYQNISAILDSMDDEVVEELLSSLGNIYTRLQSHSQLIDELIFSPNDELIYWIEIKPENLVISLNSAPLHIGNLMEKNIWLEKDSVILTSATLTTGGDFEYIKNRLNAYDVDELALGSPFDYENAALLFVPKDMPPPHDRFNYQKAVEHAIIRLSKATQGRTMVLFTSIDQLKRTSNAISTVMDNEGILIYEQGDGLSPHNLLEGFKASERAILLGTKSFWEGVDIPGEDLSVLVIVRLPFDVPSDPIVSARSEMFEDPFYQFSLPEAILRFRQGFGRLIRTQSDRGVVVVLDQRLIHKQYGKYFLQSLPSCTMRVGQLSELTKVVTEWLNL